MFIYENRKIGSKNCEFYAKSKFTPGAKKSSIFNKCFDFSLNFKSFHGKKIMLNFHYIFQKFEEK